MENKKNKIWNLYFTLIISFLIFVSFGLIQTLLAFMYGANNLEDINNHVGLISLISSFVGCFLIIITIKIRGSSVIDYLNLRKTNFYPFKIIGSFLMLLIMMEALANSYPNLFEDQFAVDIYQATNKKLLLFLGIVLFGPVFEEFLFRGFLFKGLENSIGGSNAIIISAFLFSFVHIQYSIWILLFMVFPMALFLGYVRFKTQSLLFPIGLHCLNNFITFLLVYLGFY